MGCINTLPLRRVVPWVTVGTVTALSIPLLQAALVWRSARPAIPGPHDQDGVLPGRTDLGEPVRFVWLGDSLASGVGAASAARSFPRRAVARWNEAEGRSVALTCLARPGSCAADVLAEQVPAAIEVLEPGMVAVVTVGANDVAGLTHPRRFSHEYAEILHALTGTGATVVAVGLPDLGSAAVIPRPLRAIARLAGRRADRQVQRLARAHGAHFVSIDTRASWRTKPATYLAADRWHPNDDTYDVWAGRVAALVTPLLAFTPA